MLEVSPPDRTITVLLLLAIAGCVDAVGLAETGHYFLSFMSGNTTQLGMSLAFRDWHAALFPLGLVALFVGGTTLGALVAERARRFAAGTLLLLEAALLALAGTLLAGAHGASGLLLLPVAMGFANIVTLRAGEASPGVTYATGTLVQLGVALAGLGGQMRWRRVMAPLSRWLALLCGAVLGAAGRQHLGPHLLFWPAGLLLLLALIDLLWLARRRPA